MKILISDNNLGDSAMESEIIKESLGADVRIAQCSNEEELLKEVRAFDPDAMIVQWAPVTSAVIDASPNCKFISRMGIGVDMIDVESAAAAGITIKNVPHYCTEEVASHAVALLLALNRRVVEFDSEIRAGMWNAADNAKTMKKLSSSTVGLLGLGRIGKVVGQAMNALGAELIAVDPIEGTDQITRVSMEELAERADFISVHAPLLPETHHVLGEEFFDRCKRQPIVVNTSRGQIIDTVALTNGLRSGQIGGAGLDVFESEPVDISHPLFTAPRTILTPHAAWCSADALPELRRQTAQNVVDYFGSRTH
jgi:D-3-phosphoglycerate dehydrogenase